MATLSTVKKDMGFYKNLFSLLKVLKGIAVSQYHILDQKTKSFSKFSLAVNNFLGGMETTDIQHVFVNPKTEVRGVIAVTSDSGLLGGLNVQVMKRAFEELKSADDHLMIIGSRGKIYAQEEHIPYTGFPGIEEEQRLELALTIRDHALEKAITGKIGHLFIIYPRAYSLSVQRIEKINPLPYGQEQEGKKIEKLNLSEFIQESSLESIVEYLVYLWLGQHLYDILGQAKLAELGARFMHLESSSQRIEDLDKSLRLKYFRLKHELTDASMREIFASRLIHKGKL